MEICHDWGTQPDFLVQYAVDDGRCIAALDAYAFVVADCDDRVLRAGRGGE
jgi:hypothetical protein